MGCRSIKGTGELLLKLDPGAQGNALPLRTFKQMYGDRDPSTVLTPTGTHLTSYSGHSIDCIGKINFECKYGDSSWTKSIFYVVDVPGPVVLGLPMCEALKLISVNCRVETIKATTEIQTVADLQRLYPEQFDTIGSFKEPAKIILKAGAEPHIDRPRKYSIHLQPKIEAELKSMQDLGVIRRVTEHTDWCSSIVYSTKKDGSLRVCLDPRRLNQAIKRCPHKIPTLEEVNPKFTGAKFFTKLDAKAGYWSVPLDEQSQLLTTFRTPIGRYCFLRLPFGLSISQDIFQQRMDEILENLKGCISIADDICVVGSTEEEHDANLLALMESAKKAGLVFNSAKCEIKQDKISFFGNVYTKEGIFPDPKKVNDIKNMPVPQDKEDLQRFLGMVTYMGSFIPNLSQKASPLRELVKSDIFEWSEDYHFAFDTLKDAISEKTSIAYYDSDKPIILEVDASLKGLGATLIQEGRPICFASKTLTQTQSNYSNIEREMLAVVHGVERFHTYLFGRWFKVITDHKPLVMICAKPILAAPPRLQRMLLRLQGYNFCIEYRSGASMILSDTLSRLPNPKENTAVELDTRVDTLQLDLISFSQAKQQALRRESQCDPTLSALAEVVYSGWPESIKDLPTTIRSFWSSRDTIGLDNGILFKGRQVIIPETLQDNILKQLHKGHLGIEKSKLLAKTSVFWPGINHDIENVVKHCKQCQENQDLDKREPMIASKIPPAPWKIIASDLFDIDGETYLLIADYYSKFPIVKHIKQPVTSKAVTHVIEDTCGLFGRPDEIRTDNGPQYSAEHFQKFCQEWEINHITSSPHYPQSNGFIERQVRWVKKVIKKCIKQHENIAEALLNLRITPVDNSLPSPAEMMFGRQLSSKLPTRQNVNSDVVSQLQERSNRSRDNYNKSARKDPLPPLHVGQNISVYDKGSTTWEQGKVIEKCNEPRSYVVSTPNGAHLRRNRLHLKPRDPTNQSQENTQNNPNPDRSIAENPNTENTKTEPNALTTRYGRQIVKPKRFDD